jgi:phosphoenolpyruvate synthase/pyruvate phosphate dikinase
MVIKISGTPVWGTGKFKSVPSDFIIKSMTEPEDVQKMKKSKGVITSQGGPACHAAIVCRMLDIPCITGADMSFCDETICLNRVWYDLSSILSLQVDWDSGHILFLIQEN